MHSRSKHDTIINIALREKTEAIITIYLMLLAVAVISLFHFIFSEYKSHMTAAVVTMLVTLSFAYFFFILYVCKVSFHLSLFKQYFPLPRNLVMFLYSFPLSRKTVLSLLNLFCVLFLTSNVWLSQMFWPSAIKRHQKGIIFVVCIAYVMQLLLYDPYVYIRAYSALYPQVMTRQAIKDIYHVLHSISKVFNITLLCCCVLSVLYGYRNVPPLKVMRASFIVFFLSYTTLVVTYLTFFMDHPRLLIDYAAKAGIVTYQLLFFSDNIPAYGMYPYILTLLVFLLIFMAYRLTILRGKLDTRSLSISQTIEAANMPTRTFCHFMKNEVLSLTAELEEIIGDDHASPAMENMQKHLEWLYKRLDDIHHNIREGVMQMKQVPLDELIHGATEELRTSKNLEDITLKVSLPEEIPMAFVDPQYLEHALINLLHNACDALKAVNDGRSREITIGLYSKMHWTLLDISDNGCGIAEENLTNIFTLFFSTKPMTQSWGIGLSLTHKIVTSMGGRIEVESKVDKGTTFHILLPSVK